MLKVLIVDDEPFIREGLKVIIQWEKEGYVITGEAKNAYEAIELLQRESFDLIFVDIRMPKMNGIELSHYIREKLLSDIYIIFLTGYLDIEYVNSAFKVKAIQYLQKPVQPEVLVDILKLIRGKLELKRAEEKKRLKNAKDLKEYYLVELVQGVKNLDNIRYLHMFFRGEGDIYYIHFIFYCKDRYKKQGCNINEEFLEVKKALKSQLMERAYHIISHVGGQQEYALGLIVTGKMLTNSHLSIYELVDCELEELPKLTSLKVVARIGKKVEDISKLGESYQDAINAIPYSIKSRNVPLELRLTSYLQAHYMENITLKSLSETFYVNTAYLGQLFKKQHGVFLKDYLNSIRVQKAAELLVSTSLKIYQVAESVGFQSTDSLISTFSKELGVTPQKYRMMKERESNETH